MRWIECGRFATWADVCVLWQLATGCVAVPINTSLQSEWYRVLSMAVARMPDSVDEPCVSSIRQTYAPASGSERTSYALFTMPDAYTRLNTAEVRLLLTDLLNPIET